MTTPLLPTDTLWERAGVAQKSHSRATHPASCIYICISGNYCLIIAKPLPKHALSLTRARAANPHTATTPLCARQMNETSETATCLFASTSCVSVAFFGRARRARGGHPRAAMKKVKYMPKGPIDAACFKWLGIPMVHASRLIVICVGVGAVIETFMVKLWIGQTNCMLVRCSHARAHTHKASRRAARSLRYREEKRGWTHQGGKGGGCLGRRCCRAILR